MIVFPMIEMETPTVLVDRKILLENIETVQQIAHQHQLKLRPHVKTHKSIAIAKLQLAAGAVGITAAKVDEAIPFIRNGIRSITIAYPIVAPEKIDRLLLVAKEYKAKLRLIVDSLAVLNTLHVASLKHQYKIPVYLKIDVGLHRCGLDVDDPLILALAAQIESKAHPFLRFIGLLSHAGHAYMASDKKAVAQIAQRELDILRFLKQKLRAQKIKVKEISVGATPTVLAAKSYAGITEIRPGNYVFMDRTPLRLKLIKRKNIALTILATIVSVNAKYYIIDAGSKVLSSDTGGHGSTKIQGFGVAYPLDKFGQKKQALIIEKLSEEHGFVARTTDIVLKVGDKLRIIPNHACAVVNLANMLFWAEGDQVLNPLLVDARGKVY